MAFLNFNAQSVAPQEQFECIPAGVYTAYISESEIVATKSGSGQMLKLNWRIADGPMKGRIVFDRINIVNANPKAEEIGQRQLSTLCHAVGVLQLTDTQQLHGVNCQIRVTVRKDDSGQYGDQNEVKDYRAIAGAAAPGQAAPANTSLPGVPTGFTPAPATAKHAGAVPPWAANKAA